MCHKNKSLPHAVLFQKSYFFPKIFSFLKKNYFSHVPKKLQNGKKLKKVDHCKSK